jgi:hypothetical protein
MRQAQPRLTLTAIAERFGISRMSVGDLLHNRTWIHLPR